MTDPETEAILDEWWASQELPDMQAGNDLPQYFEPAMELQAPTRKEDE